ncbi:hypothetical protein ACQP25_30535 [Microtetraspora malaysiensis]|uniref:hypothetical protein n=1 Tax=Microtetraspora malaysiensis TaxID=161358 RepID=UPI003D937E7F
MLVSLYLLLPVSLLLRLAGGFDAVAEDDVWASDIQLMVWLARSTHDLAAPHARPAPSPPLLAVPPAFAVGPRPSARARFATCAAGPCRGQPVSRPLAGDVAATLWRVFEFFAGIGGLAVVVLLALRPGGSAN